MQKRTNAGKPAGRKPDRRGLFGLFAKKKDIPTRLLPPDRSQGYAEQKEMLRLSQTYV